MLLLNYCKFVAFSILLRTQTVHSKVLLPFIQRYLRLPIFCGNFWKARKNIPVFENDSQKQFKIIFQSLVNLQRRVDARKYKPSQI